MKKPEKNYRHELKYIISNGTYYTLRQRLSAVMKPDLHGASYRVTSLYFDDIYRSAYNDKLLGLNARKKYRIRVYNFDSSFINLEVKEKLGELVAKRKSLISAEQFYRILSGDYTELGTEKFYDTAAQELYAARQTVRVTPLVVTDYQRDAFVCPHGNVRVTFDRDLKTTLSHDILNEKQTFFSTVPDGTTILEVKYSSYIPSYIQALFGGMELTQQSASKFVFCLQNKPEVKQCSL